jgi:hypothetical protein
MKYEKVSLEDCYGVSTGGEDDMIEKIDNKSEGMWDHRPDRVDSEYMDFEEYEE